MCANCNSESACPCKGGSILSFCACERGYACTECGHEAVEPAADSALLIEIIRPEFAVEAE